MNNLAYMGQDPEKIAPKIEEIIRKDLELTSEIMFAVEQTGEAGITARGFMGDAKKALFGGKATPLFAVCFYLQQPRDTRIAVNVVRQGMGCHAGAIEFSTFLNKAISGPVNMEGSKTFGSSKFIGDSDTAAKLNNNKDLLKLLAKFAREKSDIGNMRMNRYVTLEPTENGTLLEVITLARTKSMGFGATTDAKDFFEIAALAESAL